LKNTKDFFRPTTPSVPHSQVTDATITNSCDVPFAADHGEDLRLVVVQIGLGAAQPAVVRAVADTVGVAGSDPGGVGMKVVRPHLVYLHLLVACRSATPTAIQSFFFLTCFCSFANVLQRMYDNGFFV
jgi:hypothetical protein